MKVQPVVHYVHFLTVLSVKIQMIEIPAQLVLKASFSTNYQLITVALLNVHLDLVILIFK